NQCRRNIECVRTLYRRDELDGVLPLGELQSLALAGETYRLAFTPGLLAQAFQRPQTDGPIEALLPDPVPVLGAQSGASGGYLQSQQLRAIGSFPVQDAEDYWWAPSGQSFFSPDAGDSGATELAYARQHFFRQRR